MFRLLDDGYYIALLGDNSSVEHDYLFADLVGGGEIVGDVDDGDAEFGVELSEVLEDGRPERGVDHRDRFVGDDKFGAQEKGTRDHHALPLSSAELVGVSTQGVPWVEADLSKGVLDHLDRFVVG